MKVPETFEVPSFYVVSSSLGSGTGKTGVLTPQVFTREHLSSPEKVPTREILKGLSREDFLHEFGREKALHTADFEGISNNP